MLVARGAEELRRLVTDAEPGELSLEGELKRLSALDPTEYELARKEAAKKHGVRIGFLDDARRAARAEAEAAEEAAKDDPPYHEPVTDLAAVLDAALVEVQRYVVAPEQDLATAVVWGAHAHLVHHPTVQLLVSRNWRLSLRTSSAATLLFSKSSAPSFPGRRRAAPSPRPQSFG